MRSEWKYAAVLLLSFDQASAAMMIDSRTSESSFASFTGTLGDGGPIPVDSGIDTFDQPGTYESPFGNQVSTASMGTIDFSSTVDLALGTCEFCSETESSSMLVEFTLSNVHDYSISLDVFSPTPYLFGGFNQFFTYELSDSDGNTVFSFSDNDVNQANPFSASSSGSLLAGSYLVDISVSGQSSVITGVDFTLNSYLNLTAVPVPAAVWLFASGLFSLIGMARRS